MSKEKHQILIEISEDGTIDFRTTYETRAEVFGVLMQTAADVFSTVDADLKKERAKKAN